MNIHYLAINILSTISASFYFSQSKSSGIGAPFNFHNSAVFGGLG